MNNPAGDTVRPRIGVVTTRLDASQTFLARDLTAWQSSLDVTLYVLSPLLGRASDEMLRELSRRGITVRVPRLTDVLRANLSALRSRPRDYFRALADVLSLQWPRPRSTLISCVFFPVAIAHATHMCERRVNLVHGYWASYATTAARAIARFLAIPYTMAVHAHDILERRRALQRKALDAAVVLVCSRSIRDRLLARVPALDPGRVVLSHHGVDAWNDGAAPHCGPRNGRRLEILSIGRLVPKKGFDVLITAVNTVARAGCNVRCTICGPQQNARHYRHLQRLARRCHPAARVEFLGWRPYGDIPKLLSSCDVYVQPSVVDPRSGDRDGIPNAVLEAMIAGAPVIASDVGGLPEAVVRDRAGLLVPAGDAEALANAILHVVEHPELTRRRTEVARTLVAQRFAAPGAAAPWLNAVRRLTGPGSDSAGATCA